MLHGRRPLALTGALARALAFALAFNVVTLQAATAAPVARDYQDPHFAYFVTGDPLAPGAARTVFGIALMGGGGRVDEAFRAIATRAGHGHVVILRAVSDGSFDPTDGDYGEAFMNEWGPVVSAETIVFHDRAASYDPRVLEALRRADGIFLAGGDQANYLHYWKGTPVQELLNAHVAANRPIGGSSAGLAILGHYSYTAADGGSLESKVALSDPYDPGVTLESDLLHFRHLDHVITDSHFSARCRLGRLIAFVARLAAEQDATVFGLGIDEHSAVLVDDTGQGRLLAGSEGSAWLVRLGAPASTLAPGKPLRAGRVSIDRLDGNSTLDLRRGAVVHPAASGTIGVRAGTESGTSFASGILRRETVPPDED